MNRWQRWLFHLANLLVCGTGAIYAWMVYVVKPANEWSVVNHPWQPQVQHLHVVVAPLLVFALGVVWSVHVAPYWRERAKYPGWSRWSGLALAVMAGPLVCSGYLLQVSVEERWRGVWDAVHSVGGAVWVAVVVAHLAAARRLKARGGRAAEPPGFRPAGRAAPDDRTGRSPAGGRGRGWRS